MSKGQKKSENVFIKFTPLQRRLLREINRRHAHELNSVLEDIAKDMGLDVSDDSVQYIVSADGKGFIQEEIPQIPAGSSIPPSPQGEEDKTNGKKSGCSSEKEL